MVNTLLRAGNRIGQGLRSRTVSEINEARLQRPFGPASEWYDLLTGYYRNDPYNAIKGYTQRGTRIRSPYNPTHRAVNWYAGHWCPAIYGVIPFASDTPQELEDPIMTAFSTWGNWLRIRRNYATTAGMLGNVLLEMENDVDAGRIYPVIHSPRFVTNIELSRRWDVDSITIEIPQIDDQGRAFKYGKTTTRETITTLYNGEPKGYDGQPATIPNPFPFVPFVWVPFAATGDTLGAPVIEGVISKIDEANRIATGIHDYIARFSRQGVMLSTKGGAKGIEVLFTDKRESAPVDDPYAEQDRLQTIVGPEDLGVHKLIENLGLGEAFQYLDLLLGEIGKDLPETTVDEDLRAIPNISGVAAMRLTSDVVNRLSDVQTNLDWGLIRGAQMAVTMGAMMSRLRVGGWAAQTDAQKLFLPFDEGSFDRGELDFTLEDRPLMTETATERIAEAKALEGLTTPTAMKRAGMTDGEIYGEDVNDEALSPPVMIGLIAEKNAAADAEISRANQQFNAGFLG